MRATGQRQLGGGRNGSAAPARLSVVPRAAPKGGPPGGSFGDRKQRNEDNTLILAIGGWLRFSFLRWGRSVPTLPPAPLHTPSRPPYSTVHPFPPNPAGLGLTVLVVLALRLGGDSLGADDGFALDGGFDSSFGAGDALGALLWGGSLYFCSPVQLLLLFFGFIETERPSDWVLRRLGLAAGLDVDALDYRVPAALQAAAVAGFGAAGVAIAWALQALLGDATWSVSTGGWGAETVNSCTNLAGCGWVVMDCVVCARPCPPALDNSRPRRPGRLLRRGNVRGGAPAADVGGGGAGAGGAVAGVW